MRENKVKCLLIEDDPNKALKILQFMGKEFAHFNVEHQKSYQSGLNSIFNTEYDLILLDMSLPTYDLDKGAFSGKPRNFGGRDILKEMKRYRKLSKVILITQYNEFDGGLISLMGLDKTLEEKYADTYSGYVYYNSSESEWQQDLIEIIKNILP